MLFTFLKGAAQRDRFFSNTQHLAAALRARGKEHPAGDRRFGVRFARVGTVKKALRKFHGENAPGTSSMTDLEINFALSCCLSVSL